MLVSRIISRNAHQKFAEILPAQEADEGPWRVLEPLNNVFAIFDPSLADPGGDIVNEIPIAPKKVRDDETVAGEAISLGTDFGRSPAGTT